jgi:hypothetical protein
MLESSTAVAAPEAPEAESEGHGEFGSPDVPAFGSRSAEFGSGAAGAGRVAPAATPASLEQQQAQSQAPGAFHATGTNMQLVGSGTGSSQQDQGRMLIGGGFLPTVNGSAQDSYSARRTIMSTTAQAR